MHCGMSCTVHSPLNPPYRDIQGFGLGLWTKIALAAEAEICSANKCDGDGERDDLMFSEGKFMVTLGDFVLIEPISQMQALFTDNKFTTLITTISRSTRVC